MNKLTPKLSRCPSCHRKGMRRQVMDVELNRGKRVAHGIEVDVCPHCGEQLYDPPAMRAIEAAPKVSRLERGKKTPKTRSKTS